MRRRAAGGWAGASGRCERWRCDALALLQRSTMHARATCDGYARRLPAGVHGRSACEQQALQASYGGRAFESRSASRNAAVFRRRTVRTSGTARRAAVSVPTNIVEGSARIQRSRSLQIPSTSCRTNRGSRLTAAQNALRSGEPHGLHRTRSITDSLRALRPVSWCGRASSHVGCAEANVACSASRCVPRVRSRAAASPAAYRLPPTASAPSARACHRPNLSPNNPTLSAYACAQL